MANHMEEVAKMLGVELGEEFEVDSHSNMIYCFDNYGLKCNGFPTAETLMMLLTGKMAIKRKPWRPKDKENFYFVAPDGYVICYPWNNKDSFNINLYKLGNCYRTTEEAKANCNKWVAFYASDKVLEV